MYFKGLIVMIFCFVTLTLGAVKFTNIKCEAFDKEFATITKCQLKMVQRGVAALDVYVKLLKVPVTNLTVTTTLYKKASGYRPFLYNTTSNFCEFMKNKKKYPFLKIIIDMLSKDSNINHTCPYYDDIILRDMVLKDSMFKYLPLPGGEYMIHLITYAYNDPKGEIKAYFQQIE